MDSSEISVGDRVRWSSAFWVVTDVGDEVRIEREREPQFEHEQEAMRFERATFEGRLASDGFDMHRLSDNREED